MKGLPHNWETERSLLGGLLLDAGQLLEVRESLKAEDFHRPAHQHLFGVICAMSDAGVVPDPTTVLDEIERRSEAEKVGGIAYVVALPQACASVENLRVYAQRVKEYAVRRQLLLAARQIEEDIQEGVKDLPLLLDTAEKSIFEISNLSGPRDWHPLSNVIDEQILEIQRRASNPGDVTGVTTGFVDLDKRLAGLQKTDLIVLAARPAMGKCLAADAEVVLADGSIATMEELYRRRDAELLTLRPDLRFTKAVPSAYVDDGHKPVFRVTTRLGRRVEATLPHPFLTVDGWRRLEELGVGDRIGVPRRIDVQATGTARPCEVKLLGYLLGDGGLTDGSPEFTNSNPRIFDDYVACVDEFGGLAWRTESVGGRAPTVHVRAADRAEGRRVFGESLAQAMETRGVTGLALAASVGVSAASVSHWRHGATAPAADVVDRIRSVLGVDVADAVGGGNAPNPLTLWLRSLGLAGLDSHAKHIPAFVFRLRPDLVALLLNRLFATDGWATVLKNGQAQLGYASVSERLARQVQHLLLRFGVIAKLRFRTVAYRGGRRGCWQLDVTQRGSIETFADKIGIYGKEDALARAVDAVCSREPHENLDLVPRAVWSHIAAAKGAESWAGLARRAGLEGASNIHVGKRDLSRARLGRLALAVGSAELAAIATSDVYWDEIVSIEPMGMKQVYDLTIPDTHNFVADDICVHNTAFVLNLALNAALKGGVAVGLFSLEMSRHQLATRMLCSQARVDASKVRTGDLDPNDDWRKLIEASEELHRLPILIDDTPGLTITQLRSKARRLKAERPDLGLLIIDYLQLMQGTGGSKESRENVISNISRGMKILAKELDVPVIALSQLNRSLESRENKRPLPSDLRESGAIEQDADVILFIYRDEVYHEDSPKKGIAEIIIAKQRSGPIGTVELAFLDKYILFQNLAGPGEAPNGYF